METIKITYGKLMPTSFSDLHDLQGNLKELSEEAYASLKKEILETGFSFAPHAWRNPKKRKLFLIDGHQRVKALRRLQKEGYKVPLIPTIIVEARTEQEAKRKVMQGISQYGKVTQQSLFDFINEAGINIEDIDISFDIPGIDLGAFKLAFFGEPEQQDKPGSVEINEADISASLVHTCPKCGFSFASPK